MTTNLKAAKVQAKEIFSVAYDKIQNITVKGGFLNMQNQELDWNGRMIVVANLLWDVAGRQKQTAAWLADEVDTIDLTNDAEEAVKDIETFLILSTENLIGQTIEGWNENYQSLTISEEILSLVEDATDTLQEQVLLLGELGVLFAKAVRSDLRSINADTEETDDYIQYARQIAQDMVVILDASDESDEYEVEEIATTAAPINQLDAIFASMN